MSGWLDLKDAPLGEAGLVWSSKLPDRNDMIGVVHEYADGERFVSSGQANNVEFSKWHKLPDPPNP